MFLMTAITFLHLKVKTSNDLFMKLRKVDNFKLDNVNTMLNI